MSGDLRACLKGCIDSVLGVRECIGAQLADVTLITRTWNGERVGDGEFTDVESAMHPCPGIKDYSHDVRLTEAGNVKQGDLILTSISMNKYSEADLRTDTGIVNVEKLIKVGRHLYRTIHVKENLVTWDVHIRKVHQDETEENKNV